MTVASAPKMSERDRPAFSPRCAGRGGCRLAHYAGAELGGGVKAITPGTRFGRYEILGLIGASGTGFERGWQDREKRANRLPRPPAAICFARLTEVGSGREVRTQVGELDSDQTLLGEGLLHLAD